MSARTTLSRGSLPGVHWSPIALGAAIAIAAQLLFTAFGAALFDAGDARQGRELVPSLWLIVTLAISAFIGASVAVRTSASAAASAAQVHAVGVWALLLIGGALLRPRGVVSPAEWFGFGGGIAMLLALGAAVYAAMLSRRQVLRAHTFEAERRPAREQVERRPAYEPAPQRRPALEPERRPAVREAWETTPARGQAGYRGTPLPGRPGHPTADAGGPPAPSRGGHRR